LMVVGYAAFSGGDGLSKTASQQAAWLQAKG
jgi:hypothetical protein